MKKLQIITLALFLTTLSTLTFSGIGFASDNSVQGYIIGDPKEGININIYKVTCGSDQYIDTVISDSEGYYSYSGLDDSLYRLVPEANNSIFEPENIYAPLWYHLENISYVFRITKLVSSMCSSVSSYERTMSGFVFAESSLDEFTVDVGSGSQLLSIINEGELENGRVYTGAEVAVALETAISTLTSDIEVDYNSNGENYFSITNGSGAHFTIKAVGDLVGVSGITEDHTIADGDSDYFDEARFYYVISGVNDSFGITVDNNPNTGTPVTVRIDEGNYSSVELAFEMQTTINETLADASESVTVDVRYDGSDPLNKVFIISSSSHHVGSSIDLDPGINNFLSTINISEYDEQVSGDCAPTSGEINVNLCKTWLKYTDSSLIQAHELIVNARTLAIQMANSTNEEQLEVIALQVEHISEQLLQIANTTGLGMFIFSGSKTETLPFTMDENLNVIYHGDNNKIIYSIDETTDVSINITGQEAFIDGTNTFDVLKHFYQALSDGDLLEVAEVLEELELSQDQLVEKRVIIWTAINQLESL